MSASHMDLMNYEHVCQCCHHHWCSQTAKEARGVRVASKVNGEGPFCSLCLHLEMAARYADARGYTAIREAMTAWEKLNQKEL